MQETVRFNVFGYIIIVSIFTTDSLRYPNTSSKERTSNNMSAALKWREKNELIIKGRTSNKLALQLFECPARKRKLSEMEV